MSDTTKGTWRRPISVSDQELTIRERLIYGTQAERLYSCDWLIENGTEKEKEYARSLKITLLEG